MRSPNRCKRLPIPDYPLFSLAIAHTFASRPCQFFSIKNYLVSSVSKLPTCCFKLFFHLAQTL